MEEQCMFAQTGKVWHGCSTAKRDCQVIVWTRAPGGCHNSCVKVYARHISVQQVETAPPLERAHGHHHIAGIGPSICHDPEEWGKEQVVVAVGQKNTGARFLMQLAVQCKGSVQAAKA